MEHNLALGQRRADAVRNYMIEHGIEASRLHTKSFGESDPAVPNDGEPNRKLNRHVNFHTTIPFTASLTPVTDDAAAR